MSQENEFEVPLDLLRAVRATGQAEGKTIAENLGWDERHTVLMLRAAVREGIIRRDIDDCTVTYRLNNKGTALLQSVEADPMFKLQEENQQLKHQIEQWHEAFTGFEGSPEAIVSKIGSIAIGKASLEKQVSQFFAWLGEHLNTDVPNTSDEAIALIRAATSQATKVEGYMVSIDGSAAPKHVHDDIESATQELQRLAGRLRSGTLRLMALLKVAEVTTQTTMQWKEAA